MVSVKAFLTRVRDISPTKLLRTAPHFASEYLRSQLLRAFYWSRLHATAAARKRRRRAALDRLEDADRILFLCRGNVCRSPFAEYYMRNQLTYRGLDGLDVDSGGSVALDDPRSPLTARTVATNYGVDLAGHRAVESSDESIETADLLLVMDYKNYHTYATRHPSVTDRLFLLRIFEPSSGMRIPDPHGYDESVFESVYADIADAVSTVVDAYEARWADAENEPRAVVG